MPARGRKADQQVRQHVGISRWETISSYESSDSAKFSQGARRLFSCRLLQHGTYEDQAVFCHACANLWHLISVQ